MIKKYDGVVALNDSTKKNKIHLNILIAETSLWANPEVHRYLLTENGLGSFYPNTRRCRQGQGEKKGMVLEGIRLDDNTYANYAIKKAIGIPRTNLLSYTVCHIWPKTCYDVRYHTNIANLVLIPSAIAGLSDHDAEVIATLQYRAYELYNWHPKGKKEPIKPSYYPNCWKEPFPFTMQIAESLKRRSSSNQTLPAHSDNAKIIKSDNEIRGINRLGVACPKPQHSRHYPDGLWKFDTPINKLEKYEQLIFELRDDNDTILYILSLPTPLIERLLDEEQISGNDKKKNIRLNFIEKMGKPYIQVRHGKDVAVNKYA